MNSFALLEPLLPAPSNRCRPGSTITRPRLMHPSPTGCTCGSSPMGAGADHQRQHGGAPEQTASEYAYHLVQNTPEEQAVAEIARRYRVKKEIIQRDYHDLIDRLETLIDTPDLDPVTFLDFDRRSHIPAPAAPPTGWTAP
jgi:hypothetical protein